MTNSGLHDEHAPGRVGDHSRQFDYIAPSASIHPDARVGNTAEWVGRDTMPFSVQVGERSIIRAFVTVDAGVERHTSIGEDVLLMAHVHVGHDVVIGDRCQVAPHTSIGGCVTVGNDVKIGMGVRIKPHVTIGAGARLGMGAVVIRDVPPGEVHVGNPARRIST